MLFEEGALGQRLERVRAKASHAEGTGHSCHSVSMEDWFQDP